MPADIKDAVCNFIKASTRVSRLGKGSSSILISEFLRYVVVGGVAFLADFGTLVLAQETVFKHVSGGIYVSTSLGFVVGLFVNYVLSLMFVFTQPKDRGRGRSVGAFLVFGAIGIVGLGLTEFGMWLGVSVLDWNYMFVKAFVTGVVLFWNYLGRKILIFNSKTGDAKL